MKNSLQHSFSLIQKHSSSFGHDIFDSFSVDVDIDKEIVDGINVILRGHSPHTACMIIAMNYFCMVMDFPHTHSN